MRELGLHSYRFSIAWPRVMPDGSGPVNQRGLDFYRRLVEGIRERGITPMATLFHWDLPQSLQDQGGWESRDTAYRFADYAAAVYAALADDIPTWLTINEPKTVVQNGYLWGIHAPGFIDPEAAYAVAHHLALAHGLAVRAFRAHSGSGRIGPAFNLHPTYPADGSDGARAAAELHDGYENRLYLDPVLRGEYPEDVLADLGAGSRLAKAIQPGDLEVISSPVDLLAVQYYCPIYVDADRETVNRWPTSQAFWQQIYPQGLYDILTRVTRDYGPMPILHHRERPALPRRARPGRDDRGPRPDHVPARPLRQCASGDRGRRPAGELPRVVVAGQLRVAAGLRRAVGTGLRGLRHAAAHPEAQRPVVPGRDRPQRHLTGLTRGKEGAGSGPSHWGRGRERGLPRPPAPDPAPATARWPGSSRRCRGTAARAPGTPRACRG
jgi:hypothetical protein